MYLNFLSEQCLLPESFFQFFIQFMLSHKGYFCSLCCLSPFENFSQYFIAGYALIKLVSHCATYLMLINVIFFHRLMQLNN